MAQNDLEDNDLRRDLGFSNDTITRLNKDRDVKLSTIERICKFYKLDIEDVVKIK